MRRHHCSHRARPLPRLARSLAFPLILALATLAHSHSHAALFGVPNGATNPNGWFVLTGPTSANGDGDAVHQLYFKIEVTGTTLQVLVFDPGNTGARDLARGGTTTITYTLRDPAGTVIANVTQGGDTGLTDDRLVQLDVSTFRNLNYPGGFSVQPGLYELQVTMNSGDDINAFGLSVPGYEVYLSTDVPAGAEAGQFIGGAVNSGGTPFANVTQPVILYPYVDRGCQITTSNYDMDAGAGNPGAGSSGSTTSRLGASTALTMSGATTYANDNLNPIQQATQAQDYGIWRLDNDTGTQQNILDWRVADYTGVTIVGANLPVIANSPIRLYLPADGSLPASPVVPAEPRIEQSLTPVGGANPPAAGSTSWYEVNVALTNPTANAMTSVTLTANVPGGQVLYESSNPPLITAGAQVTGGGSVSSEPADGGSGNVVATWASVAAGATVSLTYFVAVTPTGAGAVNVTATPASGNGTRLTYTPAFSSASFPRTENIGALCEMTIQAATSVPNAVALSKLEAISYDGEVWLAWRTESEWANLGFNVYRAEGAAGRFIQINDRLILGAGTSTLAADYLFVDPSVRPGKSYAYLLEDVERTGRRTLHGPVEARVADTRAPSLDPGAFDRVATLGGEIPLPVAAVAVAALGGDGPPAPAGASAVVAAAVGPDPPLEAASEKLVKIVSQDASGMVLELRVEDPSLSSVSLDGAPYTDVRMEGFSQIAQPGKPALPLLGVPVGIPDVADVAMAVDVLKVKTLSGLHVPAPAPELTLQPDGSLEASYVPDAAVYGGSAPFPAAPVSLGGSVRQAEQRLLVLAVSPISWSPATGALEQARRIRVRLDFHGAGAVEAAESHDARLANQFLLASRGALKIAVSETGVQALTGEALLAAGLSPDTDPRRLRLYREGREVAVLVEGEADGVLDPDDRLLFYGEALDDDHTLARTYWLMAANLMGRRMAIENGAPTGLPSGEETTPATVRLERNLVYVPFVLNGEVSNFVGESIFLDPRDQMVTLQGVTSGPATLRLRVQGATRDDGVDPDHHLAVSVNGVPVGDAFWDGFDAFQGSFDIPAGALVEGDNQVRLTPLADTGAIFDFDYVDWVEINHPRSLDRAGSSLSLETTSAGDRTLTDLAGEDPVLLDVTDPFSPRRLQGGAFEADPEGGSLVFSVGPGKHRLLMVTAEGIITPGAVWRDVPSQLHAADGTDWLAIAHDSLMAGTQPLADLRAAEGLRAAVVSVDDVYDEFGYGNPHPEAIRDYLAWQYARGGTPRLRYVLLVGDASYDERDFLGQPNRNLLSTKLLDGVFTERSSDNWFASFLGSDPMPDVALGRLPVKNEAELAVVIEKIAGYAAQPLGQDWQRRALLTADDGAKAFHAGEAAIFESSMDRVAAQLPPGFDPLALYLSGIPEAEQAPVARQAILDALGAGQLMAVYSGHGAITLWADEVIFRSDDLAALSNADRLPFVVVLNCLNGLFSAPLGDSLGESMLLKPDGGAVAFFAPTGVSPIGGQAVLGEAIARALFREGHLRIGDALVRARAAMLGLEFFEDLSHSWVLLGDPATRLALIPAPIADAGADRQVRVKTSVRLEGSFGGGDFGAPTYAWRLISTPTGSAARLDKADSRSPVLRVDRTGDYVLELTVTAGGRTSVPDTVTVHALPRAGGKGGDGGEVF